jgi:hypothetical protein
MMCLKSKLCRAVAMLKRWHASFKAAPLFAHLPDERVLVHYGVLALCCSSINFCDCDESPVRSLPYGLRANCAPFTALCISQQSKIH